MKSVIQSCSSQKKMKMIESEAENSKKPKIQSLGEADDMSLKSCSSKKIKIKRKRKQCTKLRSEDMVNLLTNFKLKKFFKREKKDTQCYTTPVQEGKIKKGDTVDISELLFTKDRDFLITYNDRDRPVQARHLKGKVIVLHFVPLGPYSEYYMRFETTILLDIYHVLQPKGGFEVVLVGVPVDSDDTPNLDEVEKQFSSLEDCFEFKFSIMPWTAIPFSDTESRKLLETRFPLSGYLTDDSSTSFVIDPTGKVLQCHANSLFEYYGYRAYPFTDERMKCISYEQAKARKCPSITELLASHERNFLINKNNQAVPLCNLEDKVIGLYFYKGDDHRLTEKLLEFYKQLAKENKFEIVLVCIHDTFMQFAHTTEKFYWQSFSEMPWLALPYKDPVCKKLEGLFNFPRDIDDDYWSEPNPNLLIIGPQGKFVERYGADIFMKYGISAYPFTRRKVAELEAEKMKKYNINNCAHLDFPLIRKDGSMAQLSQLMGKRIIFIAENVIGHIPDGRFWRMLRARYLQTKGTDDEFEVIHIYRKERYSYGKNIATPSWFRHRATCNGTIKSSLLPDCIFLGGLFAFDRDGSLVRRTGYPSIARKNVHFPFHYDVMKEVLRDLVESNKWW